MSPGDLRAGVAVRLRAARLQRGVTPLRVLSAVWLIVLLTLCAFAPFLPLPDPTGSGGPIALPPGRGHLLGTDQLGRDILSRILWGGRNSIAVGALTTGSAMLAGLALGILAGHLRGRMDRAIASAADLVLAFPGVVLVMVLTSVLGPSMRILVISLAVLGTPAFVRIARAHALAVSQREFVNAARVLGASNARIMLRHILPSVIGPVSAYALTFFAIVLVVEGTLSFVGMGLPPPTPAWGGMIAAGRSWLDRAFHIVLVPSLVLTITVLTLNLLGDRSKPAALGK